MMNDDLHTQHERTDAGDGECTAADPSRLASRRNFLFGASAAVVAVSMPASFFGRLGGSPVYAQVADYPRTLIGKLSELEVGVPVPFNYPWDDTQSENLLIKLGQPAGAGIGPDDDVVAFNTWCTHQGGPMADTFTNYPGVAGPCPLHWTTFDMTRHGMVVSGHSTMGLPQIVLEADGDDIYATGVVGLIFGYQNNLTDPSTLGG